MDPMPHQRHRRHLLITHPDPQRVAARSSSARTRKPIWVVVAPISSTITAWLVSGWPRQVIEMALHSRCSIRFHLEVPDGR
jgi:hypothetical protein